MKNAYSGSPGEIFSRVPLFSITLSCLIKPLTIGDCRREMFDHVIALNEQHLRWLLRE